jgi:V-type H+-transporting ATPase subunit C
MYWLVALPLEDNESPDHVWNKLQELTVYRNDYSINYKFKLPENLRIGTLDSLLALSDDLIKVNSAVEGTVNKLRRQLYDLQSGLAEEEREEAWVEGVSPETYIQRFTWNEAKYPSRRPPKETIQSIMETVQKLDEDLKVMNAVLPTPDSLVKRELVFLSLCLACSPSFKCLGTSF